MRIAKMAVLAGLLLPMVASCSALGLADGSCGRTGVWLKPAGVDSQAADSKGLVRNLSNQQVVLLGETHTSAEDHRWQLQTLAQLHGLKPELAIGLEMFPRRLQRTLDRWVAGELSEAEFLKQAEWDKVWSFDARLYLPLFHYARMNRLPMLALNVERDLVEAVDERGWDGVPTHQREGISRPAAPLPDYRQKLREVFAHHPEKKQDEASFARFVEAQALWDRAMAEGIAEYLRKQPNSLVVGIMGSGHVRHGYGVPHQLADLGISRVAKLLTWSETDSCEGLTAGLADAVYLVETPTDNPPRLGITMEAAKEGVRITQVTGGSIADQAGLKADDLVIEVAGRPADSMDDLRQAVQRQPHGTWLPLRVKRGEAQVDIVARFPAEP